MKKRRIILLIVPLCLGLYLVRLFYIFPRTPEGLFFRDPLEHADLVVVLEGEYRIRIDHAVLLIESGYAVSLYYPGLNEKAHGAYLNNMLKRLGPDVSYSINRDTGSTIQEARRTKEYCREKNYTSVILVTSGYHSYTSWWLFSRILRGIKITASPAEYGNSWFDIGNVQHGTREFSVFRKEQLKFIAYYFFYGLTL